MEVVKMTIKTWFKDKSKEYKVRVVNKLKKGVNYMPKVETRKKIVPGRAIDTADIYVELKKELGFKGQIASLIAELKTCEVNMIKLEEIREIWEKNYFKLGPFVNIEYAQFLNNIFIDGTTHFFGKKTDVNNSDCRRINFDVNIKIKDETKVFTIKDFPLPRVIDVPHPDNPENFIQKISTFGNANSETWIEIYEEFFKKVTDNFKVFIGTFSEKTKKKIDNDLLTSNLKNLYTAYSEATKKALMGCAREHEEYFQNIIKDSTIDISTNIDTARSELTQELYPKRVKYKHSYEVIKRVKYAYSAKGKRSADVINFEKEYEKLPNFKWLKGEESPGLDENGMPLEVADDGFVFNGIRYEKGTVLLDIYNKNVKGAIYSDRPRSVPHDWIEECDLLDHICWLENSWDEYRDDLRDGRYHPGSLTAIDYSMAANPSLWKEWEGRNEEEMIDGNAAKKEQYKIKGENIKLTGEREPSNLSPAFDKRALNKYKAKDSVLHIGKKRYYAYNEHILEVAKEDGWDNKEKIESAHITTRGVSMYIIERVTRDMKLIDEARKVLVKISDDIGWFDFGPRIFDKTGPKDPYDIDVDTLNSDMREKASKNEDIPGYIREVLDSIQNELPSP
jgi:hypothetical protein